MRNILYNPNFRLSSAFILRTRKTTEPRDQFGLSQDISDTL